MARGPTSFSTNDECGLLVEGFDTPPTVLNPHNPAYYVPLVERAGFTKVKDLYQYFISVTDLVLPERLIRGAMGKIKADMQLSEVILRSIEDYRAIYGTPKMRIAELRRLLTWNA